MPKGRHAGGQKKAGKGAAEVNATLSDRTSSSSASFTVLEDKSGLLLTLLFDSKSAQHAALSRIEAFYESTLDAKRYLTLDQANEQRQCLHYEAFNFPLSIVKQWLDCMEQVQGGKEESREEEESDTKWWKPFCNDEEVKLLDYLHNLLALDAGSESQTAPVYLISALSSQQTSLRHERLHFLFYISTPYRATVEQEYRNLSAKSTKIIEHDLKMRRYSPHVWMDEFQAYVSEDPSEFGSSTRQECQAISQTLQRHQRRLFTELKLF